MIITIDGVVYATVSTGSYSTYWNTTSLARGTHVIQVTAYDLAGNMGIAKVSVVK